MLFPVFVLNLGSYDFAFFSLFFTITAHDRYEPIIKVTHNWMLLRSPVLADDKRPFESDELPLPFVPVPLPFVPVPVPLPFVPVPVPLLLELLDFLSSSVV